MRPRRMAASVDLERLASGRWHVLCGGCLKTGVTDAVDDAQAWLVLQAQGWTAYQFRAGSRIYPKCPACSAEPAGRLPRRGQRNPR